MHKLQRLAGLIWMPLGTVLFVALVWIAAGQVREHPGADTWIQWGIFVLISLPVCAGLSLFGWYAWQGLFDAEEEETET